MKFRSFTLASNGVLKEKVFLTFHLTHSLLNITGWFRSKWNNAKNRQNSAENPSELDENLDIDSGNQNRKCLRNAEKSSYRYVMYLNINELDCKILASKEEFYSLLCMQRVWHNYMSGRLCL